jgi:hypothetical protein
VSSALRPLARPLIWPLLVAVLASAMWFGIRSKRATLVDFEVYRKAAARALDQEPLYRPEDGHYQFGYWPIFASRWRRRAADAWHRVGALVRARWRSICSCNRSGCCPSDASVPHGSWCSSCFAPASSG